MKDKTYARVVAVAVIIILSASCFFIWMNGTQTIDIFFGPDGVFTTHPESLNISFTTDGCIMGYSDGTIMEGWYTNKTTVNMSNKSEAKIPCITQFNKNSSAYKQHIKVTRPPKNNSLNIYFKYYCYVPSSYYGMYYDPEITVMLYGINSFGNLYNFGNIFSVEDFDKIGRNYRFDIIIRIPKNSVLPEDYNCSIELQITACTDDPSLEVEPRYYEIEVWT